MIFYWSRRDAISALFLGVRVYTTGVTGEPLPDFLVSTIRSELAGRSVISELERRRISTLQQERSIEPLM